MRLTNHEFHCLRTCRCKDKATFRLILSADRSTWIFFFTLFKQIIVHYCQSTKHSKGHNASHNSRGEEINWKSSKTRIRKKWVTDRNGYKLHQTVVCFIEPPNSESSCAQILIRQLKDVAHVLITNWHFMDMIPIRAERSQTLKCGKYRK